MTNVITPISNKSSWKLSKKDKENICSLYANGVSGTKIAEKFHLACSSIYNILWCRKVVIRSPDIANRIKSINETAFDTINEQSAYWAGFLAADGSIRKYYSSYEISLGLNKKDIEHLYKFREFLGSNHKISFYDNACCLRVCSKKIGGILFSWGITPQKSKTLEINNRALTNNRHFWRGVIDGDGSIGYCSKYPALQLWGSCNILKQFLSYINETCGIQSRTYKDKSIFKVLFTCRRAKTLIKHFYYNSHVSLMRKKIIANNIIGK